MHIRATTRAGQRRGVILLVVLALLTLFAILGLSFVSYSDAEATSSRIYREAQNRVRFAGPNEITLTNATLLWESFLGQFTYDLPDDSFGVYSALRGHGLARNMYGWDNTPGALNDKPYAGTGRLRESINGFPFADTENAVNYQFFPGGLLRDPGRLGARNSPTAPPGPLTGDLHVAYTYPDHNNMYLAVMNPADGQVLVPSFHRPWIGGPLAPATGGNWTSPAGRYRLMRPRQQDMGPGFPGPASPTGDVKNLDWAPGGPDSIWIDINSPINTAPDGRKYKMLIAPLILELDGRINVNTAGNLMANLPAPVGRLHASNQGWGPWEVNLARVLDAAAAAGQPPQEWRNLFLGNGTILGKYGSAGRPEGTNVLPGSPIRSYYPADYNSVTDPGFANPFQLTPRFTFPLPTTQTAVQVFPTFAANAYNNGIPIETTDNGQPTGTPIHPSIYNPLRPQGSNRNFGLNSLVALLRRMDSVGNRPTSELTDLLPNNLTGTGPQDVVPRGRRNRLTTLSFDLDRPGSPPYIWNPNSTVASERYRYDPVTGVAFAPPVPFPNLSQRTTTPPPPGSEFDANWRNVLANLPRVDLVRKLTDYPLPDTTAWRYTTQLMQTQAQQAVLDRQTLAADIFARLVRVTGAVPQPTWITTYPANSPEFGAVRWLAQLAVNIVDFIDHDDFITPLQFHAGHWVFGTEAPRLVINEYYAQWDNDPAGLSAAPIVAEKNYRVNVWAELHNPFPQEVVARDPALGVARLHNGTYPMYRLLLCRSRNVNIRLPENATGAPDPVGNDPVGNIAATVSDWGPDNANLNLSKRVVQPGFNLYGGKPGENQGFYVVGPGLPGTPILASPYNAALAGTRPFDDSAPTFRSTGMSFISPLTTNPTPGPLPGFPQQQRPSLLLQRLANPYLPLQDNPAAPAYNPYITTDYVDQLDVHDGRLYDTNAQVTPVPVGNRDSRGRFHPFAASMWRPQAPLPGTIGAPQNTFFRHNAQEATMPAGGLGRGVTQTIQVPFDALVHTDRQLSSVAELMHVSGFKPHELTQQFMGLDTTSNLLRFRHRAPWTQQNTRLYRLWDHLTVRSRANGIPGAGGRVPGRVNINAMWEPANAITSPVFSALCDANGISNQFSQAEVDAMWLELFTRRSGATRLPGVDNRPFKSLGTGPSPTTNTGDALTNVMAPNERGLHETLLRNSNSTANLNSDTTERRLLEPAGMVPLTSHPLQRFELLAKIYGQLTTRSNVFGVWATVGFFEVVDDKVQPARLGPEMVWGPTGVIRHRMFAIIDRTQLQVWPTLNPDGLVMARLAAPVALPDQRPVTQTVTLTNAAGTAINSVTHPYIPGRTWNLPTSVGAYLTIDPDTDEEETVQVEAVGPGVGQFRATFTKPHPVTAIKPNIIVISRGNPGPWLGYKPTDDTAVVPFQTVLE